MFLENFSLCQAVVEYYNVTRLRRLVRRTVVTIIYTVVVVLLLYSVIIRRINISYTYGCIIYTIPYSPRALWRKTHSLSAGVHLAPACTVPSPRFLGHRVFHFRAAPPSPCFHRDNRPAGDERYTLLLALSTTGPWQRVIVLTRSRSSSDREWAFFGVFFFGFRAQTHFFNPWYAYDTCTEVCREWKRGNFVI